MHDTMSATPGKWEACGNLVRTARTHDGAGGWLIAETPANWPHSTGDAQLIAEAGTVRAVTGLTPQQLALLLAEAMVALEYVCSDEPSGLPRANSECRAKARAVAEKVEVAKRAL